MKINRLPAPTWNWLKMNESIPDTEGIKKAEGALLLRWSQAEHKRKGSCFENGAANLKPEESAEGIRIEEAGEWSEKTAQTATGMGKDMSRLLEKAGNAIVRITPEEEHTQQKVFLDFLYGKEDYRVNGVELYAPENADLTVFMNCSSDKNGRGLAAVQTRFHAGKNAKIRIVQLQMLGSEYLYLNDIGGSCEEGASVEVLQIELGGGQIYSGCRTALLRDAGMNVVLPMAANDLLTINGVDASFVAVAKNGGVNISARSMGALNVQVILEPLGGGGHLMMAGAQLQDCTLQDAERQIREQIDLYRASQAANAALAR